MSYDDFDSTEKCEFNSLILDNLRACYKTAPNAARARTILLDSTQMRTSHTLLTGIDDLRPQQLTVTEYNAIVHNAHLRNDLVCKQGVIAKQSDLFDFLKRDLENKRAQSIIAIIADLTCTYLTEEQIQVLRDTIEARGVQRLYLTLSRRKSAMTDREVIKAFMTKGRGAMQHLEMIHYYCRTDANHKGQAMRVFFFERAKSDRTTRRTVRHVSPIDHDRRNVLVHVYGMKKPVKRSFEEAFDVKDATKYKAIPMRATPLKPIGGQAAGIALVRKRRF